MKKAITMLGDEARVVERRLDFVRLDDNGPRSAVGPQPPLTADEATCAEIVAYRCVLTHVFNVALTQASDIVQTAGPELVLLVGYVGELPDPFTYQIDGRIQGS